MPAPKDPERYALWRARISASVQEVMRHPDIKAKYVGANASKWRGDQASYSATHRRLRRSLLPAPCYVCGATRNIRVQLQHQRVPRDRWKFDEREGFYFTSDPSDYAPMCVPCGNRYDNLPH